MFIAKLIGKVSGHVISHEFETEKAAIEWICGPGFAISRTKRCAAKFGLAINWLG